MPRQAGPASALSPRFRPRETYRRDKPATSPTRRVAAAGFDSGRWPPRLRTATDRKRVSGIAAARPRNLDDYAIALAGGIAEIGRPTATSTLRAAACTPPYGPGTLRTDTVRPGLRTTLHGTPDRPRNRKRLPVSTGPTTGRVCTPSATSAIVPIPPPPICLQHPRAPRRLNVLVASAVLQRIA